MKRVLVIDDDLKTIKLLESWLKKLNYEVVSVTDGFSGHTRALGSCYDLILLEAALPDMGFWLSKRFEG